MLLVKLTVNSIASRIISLWNLTRFRLGPCADAHQCWQNARGTSAAVAALIIYFYDYHHTLVETLYFYNHRKIFSLTRLPHILQVWSLCLYEIHRKRAVFCFVHKHTKNRIGQLPLPLHKVYLMLLLANSFTFILTANTAVTYRDLIPLRNRVPCFRERRFRVKSGRWPHNTPNVRS